MSRIVEPPPFTPAEPVTEVLHGVKITDPYRWLEDQDSPRTRKWIEEQTTYARAYLDAVPGRDRIRKRVEELLTEKDVISDPWKIGSRCFFLSRAPNREQHAIVMKEGLLGEERILVDPTLRSTDSSTASSLTAISHDVPFLAYSVLQAGTANPSRLVID